MPRKRQGLRVYHQKTRNGCAQCKKRRVKCDIKSPSCSNCVRRKEACEYPTFIDDRAVPLQVQWPEDHPAMAGDSSMSVVASRNNLPGPYFDPRRIQKIRLEATRPSIAPPMTSNQAEQTLAMVFQYSWFTPQERKLWVPNLARIAPKYLYLQHSLLAIVNLRGFRKCMSSTSTSEAAYEHQLIASRIFRQSSLTIDDRSWMAVLFFSICTLIHNFFTQSLCDESDFDLMETLRVNRSTLTIVMGCRPFLERSVLWFFIMQRCHQRAAPPDPRVQEAMQSLEITINSSLKASGYGEEDAYAKLIRQTLVDLKQWIVYCDQHPTRWDHYCGWPAKIHLDYFDLLEHGDDLSLVIFIHWAAIMNTSTKPFIKAWTKRAAFWALNRLEADWTPSLVWPMKVFQSYLPVPELIM